MSKFSLALYSLRVRARKTNQYVSLSSIPTPALSATSTVDLLDVLHTYLDEVVPEQPHNPDDEEIFKVDFVEQRKRGLSGRLKIGERGYGSDLVDTQTGNTDYQRTKFHAEIVPYYFLVGIPLKADKGIILFQRFKNHGIKDSFYRGFYSYFRDLFDSEYALEMDHLIPKELVKEYLKQRVVKVRLIKQGFPRDTFDVGSDAFPDDDEFTGETEFTLKAGRDGFLPKQILRRLSQGIDKFLNSDDEPIGSVIEVKNFEFDNIKVEVKVGKKTRTVDLSHFNRLRHFEDISDIETDAQGHPEFDRIDDVAKNLLEDYALGIFGGEIDV